MICPQLSPANFIREIGLKIVDQSVFQALGKVNIDIYCEFDYCSQPFAHRYDVVYGALKQHNGMRMPEPMRHDVLVQSCFG